MWLALDPLIAHYPRRSTEAPSDKRFFQNTCRLWPLSRCSTSSSTQAARRALRYLCLSICSTSPVPAQRCCRKCAVVVSRSHPRSQPQPIRPTVGLSESFPTRWNMEPPTKKRRFQPTYFGALSVSSNFSTDPPYRFHWLCFWFLLQLLPNSSSAAGGDCMSGNTIDCFDCNSWDDPRCHDPFNYTLQKWDMPPVRECEGCCVKMVQFIGTEHYQVKRTCTDNFEVNFFIVNHACMTEGHRHGRMCFCEEDECNHQSPIHSPSLGASIGLQILLIQLYISGQNLFLS